MELYPYSTGREQQLRHTGARRKTLYWCVLNQFPTVSGFTVQGNLQPLDHHELCTFSPRIGSKLFYTDVSVIVMHWGNLLFSVPQICISTCAVV